MAKTNFDKAKLIDDHQRREGTIAVDPILGGVENPDMLASVLAKLNAESVVHVETIVLGMFGQQFETFLAPDQATRLVLTHQPWARGKAMARW